MRHAASLTLALWAISFSGCRPEPRGSSSPTSDGTLSLEAHADVERAPVELIAVLNSSESMTNRQMELARSLLAQLVRILNERDRFSFRNSRLGVVIPRRMLQISSRIPA